MLLEPVSDHVQQTGVSTLVKQSRPPAKGRVVISAKDDHNSPPTEQSELTYRPAQTECVQYTYPLKLLVPARASLSPAVWVFPITFGGGLVEGDHISLDVDVRAGAAAVVTTQSSTKVFHCLSGLATRQHASCRVEPGALLAVLPDPIVCFSRAVYTQSQRVSLAAGASLVLVDWLTAGRMARGERWQFTSYKSSIEIEIEGTTVLRDAVHLEDTPLLSINSAMKHYQVCGTVVVLGAALRTLTARLLHQLGAPKAYGSSYTHRELTSISPLTYTLTGGQVVTGCYIKLAAPTTERASEIVDSILSPLWSTLGGNPYENKY